MNKIFAIIKTPTVLNPGKNIWDTPRTWIVPTRDWHEYPKVCEIPLVNEMKFYDSLKTAKANFTVRNVSVIVELDFENHKLTNFCNLYELVDTFLDKLPYWKCRSISKNEISSNALEEINRQYRLNGPVQTAPKEHFCHGH